MRCGEPVAAKRVLPLQEFQIWRDGEAEEERTRGQAVDFRGAALGFAQDTDDDHRIAKGRPVTLNIMDGAGRVERWRVAGELVPQYEVEPVGAYEEIAAAWKDHPDHDQILALLTAARIPEPELRLILQGRYSELPPETYEGWQATRHAILQEVERGRLRRGPPPLHPADMARQAGWAATPAPPAPAVPPGSCPDGVACIMAPGTCAARGLLGPCWRLDRRLPR